MSMDKKGLAIILGGLKPKKEEDDKEESLHDDKDAGLKSAFEDLLEAIGDKDVDAGVKALKDFLYMCEDEDDSEED